MFMNRMNLMVDTVLEWFHEEDTWVQEEFLNTTYDTVVTYNNSLGRDIRNYFKLWETVWEPKLVDGVDYSEEHPDQISMEVIKAVWWILQYRNKK